MPRDKLMQPNQHNDMNLLSLVNLLCLVFPLSFVAPQILTTSSNYIAFILFAMKHFLAVLIVLARF